MQYLTSAVDISHPVFKVDDRKIGNEYPANHELRAVVLLFRNSNALKVERLGTRPSAVDKTLPSELMKSARKVKYYPLINVCRSEDVHYVSICTINTF